MTATRKPRQMHTVTCRWGCGHTWQTPLKPPADGIGCGVNPECNAKHNAAVAEAEQQRREAANTRRRQRRANPPQPTVIGGGWAHVGMLLKKGQDQ